MASKPKSRWADEDEDAAADAQRRREKEEKKRAKAEKQRKLLEAEQRQAAATVSPSNDRHTNGSDDVQGHQSKRRKLSPGPENDGEVLAPAKLLRFPTPEWGPCRHVDNFERLNHIEEGSYGWVSRAKETATGEIVALKKLKMDKLQDGFPVTGLREIQTLMESRHPGVVNLREVVVGDTLDEYDNLFPSS